MNEDNLFLSPEDITWASFFNLEMDIHHYLIRQYPDHWFFISAIDLSKGDLS